MRERRRRRLAGLHNIMARWESRDRMEPEDRTACCNTCCRERKNSTQVWVTANNSYGEGRLLDRWTSSNLWGKNARAAFLWLDGEMRFDRSAGQKWEIVFLAFQNPAEIHSLQTGEGRWVRLKVSMWSSREHAAARTAECRWASMHCKWRLCDEAVSVWLWSSNWRFTVETQELHGTNEAWCNSPSLFFLSHNRADTDKPYRIIPHVYSSGKGTSSLSLPFTYQTCIPSALKIPA